MASDRAHIVSWRRTNRDSSQRRSRRGAWCRQRAGLGSLDRGGNTARLLTHARAAGSSATRHGRRARAAAARAGSRLCDRAGPTAAAAPAAPCAHWRPRLAAARPRRRTSPCRYTSHHRRAQRCDDLARQPWWSASLLERARRQADGVGAASARSPTPGVRLTCSAAL